MFHPAYFLINANIIMMVSTKSSVDLIIVKEYKLNNMFVWKRSFVGSNCESIISEVSDTHSEDSGLDPGLTDTSMTDNEFSESASSAGSCYSSQDSEWSDEFVPFTDWSYNFVIDDMHQLSPNQKDLCLDLVEEPCFKDESTSLCWVSYLADIESAIQQHFIGSKQPKEIIYHPVCHKSF